MTTRESSLAQAAKSWSESVKHIDHDKVNESEFAWAVAIDELKLNGVIEDAHYFDPYSKERMKNCTVFKITFRTFSGVSTTYSITAKNANLNKVPQYDDLVGEIDDLRIGSSPPNASA